MLLLLFVGSAIAASQVTTTTKAHIHCQTCIPVDAVCHNISFLFRLEAPFRSTIVITKLGILRSRNILYYAFEPNITDPEFYKVGYVNLDNVSQFGIVSGASVVNLITFDIVQSNGSIYYGGGDALYVSEAYNTVHFYGSKGDTIRSAIVYKNEVLFVRDGENKIVKKQGDNFKIYEGYTSVKSFLINRDGDMLFLNNSGLFLNRFETDQTVFLSKNNYFRGMAIDLNEVFYVWWIDGIYKVVRGGDIFESKLVKVANVENIGALTFDNSNNFLFTSDRGLFRLTSTNDADVIC